eukprot:GFUD01008324.1.p1 GENE.GFUD01008324.1~~GFUD01008324.1.p1  ORF type:complete len:446 (+),score=143.38 GFUD01008324.1:75-1412(+)
MEEYEGDAVGGDAVVGDVFVNTRNIDDRTLKEWTEDRTSWTKSISKRGKKTFEKLINSISFAVEEEVEKKETNRDSGVAMLEEADAAFNKVVQAVEMKKVKLDDLISTEESYLEDLGKISLYYEEAMKSKQDPNHPVVMPPGLREGRDLIAFGNIHQIIDFHKLYFTKGLRNANSDADKILEMFKKKKGDMKVRYGKFCINKPKSELIVTQFQDSYFSKLEFYLHQDMRLADQLIKPVQHLTRYDMYFRELVTLCEQAGQKEEADKFRECSKIASEISHNANDMMTAGRIDQFSGDITKQGELLHRGSVFCKVPGMDRRSIFSKSKPSARLEPGHLFLFQQCVIVCYYRERMTEIGNRDEYQYWHKFLINKMQVRDIARGGNEMEFELHDTNKESRATDNLNLTITTNTMEEKSEWVKKINKEIRSLEDLKFALGNPRKMSLVEM